MADRGREGVGNVIINLIIWCTHDCYVGSGLWTRGKITLRYLRIIPFEGIITIVLKP